MTFESSLNIAKFLVKLTLIFFYLYPVGYIIWTHIFLEKTQVDFYRNTTEILKLLYTSNAIYISASMISILMAVLLIFIEKRIRIPFKKTFSLLTLMTLFIPSNIIIRAFIDLFLTIHKVLCLQEIYIESIFQTIYSSLGMVIFLAINYSPLALALLRKKSEPLENSLIVADVLQTPPRKIFLNIYLPNLKADILKVFSIIYLASISNLGIPLTLTSQSEDVVLSTFLYKNLFSNDSEVKFKLILIIIFIFLMVWFFIQKNSQPIKPTKYLDRQTKLYEKKSIISALGYITVILIFYVTPVIVILTKSFFLLSHSIFSETLTNSLLETSPLVRYKSVFLNSFYMSALSSLIIQFICFIKHLNSNRQSSSKIFLFIYCLPAVFWAASLVLAFSNNTIIPINIYGTVWILLLCYVTRFLGLNDALLSNHINSFLDSTIIYQKMLPLHIQEKAYLLFKNSASTFMLHFIITFFWLFSETNMSPLLSTYQYKTLGWQIINLEQSGDFLTNFVLISFAIAGFFFIYFLIGISINVIYQYKRHRKVVF